MKRHKLINSQQPGRAASTKMAKHDKLMPALLMIISVGISQSRCSSLLIILATLVTSLISSQPWPGSARYQLINLSADGLLVSLLVTCYNASVSLQTCLSVASDSPRRGGWRLLKSSSGSAKVPPLVTWKIQRSLLSCGMKQGLVQRLKKENPSLKSFRIFSSLSFINDSGVVFESLSSSSITPRITYRADQRMEEEDTNLQIANSAAYSCWPS